MKQLFTAFIIVFGFSGFSKSPDTKGNAPVDSLNELTRIIASISNDNLDEYKKAVGLGLRMLHYNVAPEHAQGFFDNILTLSDKAHYFNQPDVALITTKAAKAYFLKNGFDEKYLKALMLEGSASIHVEPFDTALLKLNLCLTKLKDREDQNEYKGISLTLSNLGILHGMYGRYQEALEFFLKDDSVLNIVGEKGGQAHVMTNIGCCYLELGMMEDAAEYFIKAKTQAYELNDLSAAFSASDNLAISLIAEGRYEEALNELREGRKTGRQIGDSLGLAYNYSNTADALIELNKYEMAMQFINMSDVIYHKFNNYSGHLAVLDKKTTFYFQQRKFDEAIKTALCEYHGCLKHLFPSQAKSATWYLWQSFDSMGMYDSAYYYLQAHKAIADSLNVKNFTAQTAELREKYKTDMQQREITELETKALLAAERDQRQSHNNRLLLITSFIFLLGLGVLTYSLVSLRKSKQLLTLKNQKLEESDRQKALLLKELHHRVKNNLQIVSSLLNLQGDSVKDAEAQMAFREGQNRVDAMAMIHKHLYATDELTSVDISGYIERLIRSLAFSYGFNKSKFELEANITKDPVDVDIAIPIGLIVNELVSNSFKHAFKNTAVARLSIEISVIDSQINLYISDNGSGLPSDFSAENSSSFGLELVQTLVHQLKGNIEYTNRNGAYIAIKINPSKALAA